MIIDNDLIEKGAKAIRAAMLADPNCSLPPFEKDKVSPLIARAALQAVLPDVVEKCAQALINSGCAAPADYNWSAGWDAAVENGSDSIRSLLNKEDK